MIQWIKALLSLESLGIDDEPLCRSISPAYVFIYLSHPCQSARLPPPSAPRWEIHWSPSAPSGIASRPRSRCLLLSSSPAAPAGTQDGRLIRPGCLFTRPSARRRRPADRRGAHSRKRTGRVKSSRGLRSPCTDHDSKASAESCRLCSRGQTGFRNISVLPARESSHWLMLMTRAGIQ